MGLETAAARWEDLALLQPGAPHRARRHERTRALLDALSAHFGELPPAVKVAGTAGKGSVAAMLDAMLRRDSRRTGLFTGPHLTHPTERIRILGADVTTAELNDTAREVEPLVERLVREHGVEFRPTYYETLLMLGLRLFQRHRVDLAIVEMGIGGYNDVASLVAGPVACITTVGLDHIEELGKTIAAIAADKAGVATAGSTLVVGPSVLGEALDAVEADAHGRGVTVVRAEMDPVALEGARRLLPLAGEHQVENLCTAASVVGVLVSAGLVANDRCIAGVEDVRWPARLERLAGSPGWWIDSAHNELAFRAVRHFVESRLEGRRRELVFGASDVDKGMAGLAILAPCFDRVYLTRGYYRSVALDGAGIGVETVDCATPEEAIAAALADGGPADREIVVTGSVFLAGAIRDALLRTAANG